MCGIVGYCGAAQAAPLLLEGLGRLEYRGYDSAGVAVQDGERICVVRAAGRLERLMQRTDGGRTPAGRCGIGHTRWATHGAPDERNAHPQASLGNRVVIVHNGVIANHLLLRAELERCGCVFHSQTDTEAAVLLLDSCYARQKEGDACRRALCAIRETSARMEGSYAFCALFADQPGVVYAVRRGSPLAAGRCFGAQAGHMVASDAHALAGHVCEAVFLEDGETAVLTGESLRIFAEDGAPVFRPVQPLAVDTAQVSRGGYAHFMLKEIFEQPRAVRDTLAPYIGRSGGLLRVRCGELGLQGVRRVLLTGCGSAYHAGRAGREAIARLAGIPCAAELASELAAAPWPQRESGGTLAVIISQSGETADSLSALRSLKARGVRTLALVNAPHSAMAREADGVLLTQAGPEIAVATTKAYAAQLAALDCLAAALAAARGAIAPQEEDRLLSALLALPESMERVLAGEAALREIGRQMAFSRSAFYIGRGMDHAAAMEGALKLKEVSYIHAEAYAAGELKHGAISLIEPGMPVVGVAVQPELRRKTMLNMEEAASRGAHPILITGGDAAAGEMRSVIRLPDTEPLFAPALAAVPMQLMAYGAGCARGFDVDKPRNLAKSVTVE